MKLTIKTLLTLTLTFILAIATITAVDTTAGFAVASIASEITMQPIIAGVRLGLAIRGLM